MAGQDWQKGLFSCCDDCGLCLMACCCPCVIFGENVEKIDGTNKWLCCCAYVLAADAGLAPCLSCYFRGKIRDLHNIPGGAVGDYCTHCWCECCALIQEAQQMRMVSVQGGQVVTHITTTTTTTQPGYNVQTVETHRTEKSGY